MATVMTETHHGKTRRCDATCHNATQPKCTCICGGRYHGAGRRGDLEEKIKERQEELVGPLLKNVQTDRMGKPVHIKGSFSSGRVWLDGQELLAGPSLKVWNHSPTGFMWGYAGSGPAQLALALLLTRLPQQEAVDLHQKFKFDFIAGLPQTDFETELDLDEWIKAALAERELHEIQTKPGL